MNYLSAMKFCVIVLPILLFFAALSCDKDPNPKNFTGIYRGVFNRVQNGLDTTGTGIVFLAISSENSSFHLNGDSITATPANSSGLYEFPEPGKIQFTNTAIIGVPVYDRFYVLDTVYNFEFEDPHLKIFLGIDTMYYDYELTRF